MARRRSTPTSTRPQVIKKDKMLWRNLGMAYANVNKHDRQALDAADRRRASSTPRTPRFADRSARSSARRATAGRDRRPRDGGQAQGRRAASGGTTSVSRIASRSATTMRSRRTRKRSRSRRTRRGTTSISRAAYRRRGRIRMITGDRRVRAGDQPRARHSRWLVRSRLHVQAQQRERQGDRGLAASTSSSTRARMPTARSASRTR